MPEVSILVAVYNAEPWLKSCLDSLLQQTLTAIQVICVDDASTDGSLDLLQQYARQDARIEVVSLLENQGQAHARNQGLKRSKGRYVCMVDADDWLAPDALELAVKRFEPKTDCVLFEVVRQYEDGHADTYPLPDFTVLSGTEAFRLTLDWTLHGLYLARAELYHQHPYDETCRLYSDDNTTLIHYLVSREVGRCPGRYYYRQHRYSSTNRSSVRRFDHLRANESMHRQMVALGVPQSIIDTYEQHRWLVLVDVYMFYHVHGRELSARERAYGLRELHRVWRNIPHETLKKETTAKFGYRPCRSWRQFRLQEWLYFTLRGFLGKNR